MGRVGENKITEVSAHQHQPSLSLLRSPHSLLLAPSSAFSGSPRGIHYVTIKDRGQLLFYFTTPSRPRLQGKKSEFGISLSTTSQDDSRWSMPAVVRLYCK